MHLKLNARGGVERMLHYYLEQFSRWDWDVRLYSSEARKTENTDPRYELVLKRVRWAPRWLRLVLFNILLGRDSKIKAADVGIGLNRIWHGEIACANGNHIGHCRAQKKTILSPYDYIKIWLDKKSFKNSQLILACSKMVQYELVNDYGQPASKIKLLPLPVDTSNFNKELKQAQLQLKKKYGLSEDRINFLFVSTGHKRKGLDLLLEIFADSRLADVNLYVAGTKFRSKLANVYSLGFCDQIYELYAAADALLHPAHYEPYGLVIPESIACGTPVITAAGVGASYLVEPRLGIVCSDLSKEVWLEEISSFKPERFDIPSDFAQANKLDIESYMNEFKAIIYSCVEARK